MPILEDIYYFRLAAYRDGAYELQLPSKRAQLHATALEITERIFAGELHLVAGEMAEHARLAQRGAPTEHHEKLAQTEFKYLVLQIEQERHRASWEGVVSSSTRAIECAGRSDDQMPAVWKRRAEALEVLGRRQEAEQAWLALAELGEKAELSEQAMTGFCRAALCRLNLGDHDGAIGAFDRAEVHIKDDAVLQARYLFERSSLASARGDFVRHELELRKALAVLPSDAEQHHRFSMRGNLANTLGTTGRRKEAIAEYLELVEEFSTNNNERNLGTALANLGRQYMLEGDLQSASSNLQRAVAVSSRLGVQRSVAFSLDNLAEVDIRQGQLDSALKSAQRAIELSNELALPLYHAAYNCTLANVHLLMGHEEQAHELIEDARAEFVTAHGDAFVSEYCSPVRLRIAGWKAVSSTVVGRATSTLKAQPPAPSWLPVMRSILTEIEQAEKARGGTPGTLLDNAVKSGHRLIEEVANAIQEKRAAVVFRGYLPNEFLPQARNAMLQRLEQQSPAEFGAMQRLHPDLWAAMTQD